MLKLSDQEFFKTLNTMLRASIEKGDNMEKDMWII
jgi:hypothetical protein